MVVMVVVLTATLSLITWSHRWGNLGWDSPWTTAGIYRARIPTQVSILQIQESCLLNCFGMDTQIRNLGLWDRGVLNDLFGS